MSSLPMPAGWDVGEINKWLHYHGEATRAMTRQRTALESKLIPITAYILISAIECYRRHPELVAQIGATMSAEEIGERGRRPGNQIDAVHLWSQANIYLLGRNLMAMTGQATPGDSPERTAVVLDFWKRCAGAWRADGNLQAFDVGYVCTPYPRDVVDQLVDGSSDVASLAWPDIKKLNATLHSYMFLLYFDTRSGMVDTGPYDLGGGRTMLVRDFSKMGPSDFWWSTDVSAGLPYRNLTAAFVLKDVDIDVNDWGTSVTRPENYLDHVERFGLYTTDSGEIEVVDVGEVDTIRKATKDAQANLYRLIAAMTRKERIDAGAYVYFTFLRPFAKVAGNDAELDWTCPRDSLDLYDMFSNVEGSAGGDAQVQTDAPYYAPVPT